MRHQPLLPAAFCLHKCQCCDANGNQLARRGVRADLVLHFSPLCCSLLGRAKATFHALAQMTDADKQDERSTIPGTLVDHRVCLSNHAPIPPLFLQAEHLISFFKKITKPILTLNNSSLTPTEQPLQFVQRKTSGGSRRIALTCGLFHASVDVCWGTSDRLTAKSVA